MWNNQESMNVDELKEGEKRRGYIVVGEDTLFIDERRMQADKEALVRNVPILEKATINECIETDKGAHGMVHDTFQETSMNVDAETKKVSQADKVQLNDDFGLAL